MTYANHTAPDATETKIQAQVDKLHSSLWMTHISPEALEQKLATRRFSAAEKTCIRYAFRATKVEAYDAGEALETEWQGVCDDELSSALESALDDAKKTGNFCPVIRLSELQTMTDSCIEAALANVLH